MLDDNRVARNLGCHEVTDVSNRVEGAWRMRGIALVLHVSHMMQQV